MSFEYPLVAPQFSEETLRKKKSEVNFVLLMRHQQRQKNQHKTYTSTATVLLFCVQHLYRIVIFWIKLK